MGLEPVLGDRDATTVRSPRPAVETQLSQKPAPCNEDPPQPERSKYDKLLLKSHFCVSVALWLLSFLIFFFGCITACSILDAGSGYQTLGPCSGGAESQPRDHQGSPRLTAFPSFGPWGPAPTSALNLVGDLAAGIHRTAPSVGGPGRAVVSLSVTPVLSLAALFVRAPVTCSVSVLHSA